MAEVFLASRTSEVGGFEKFLAIKRIFSHLVTQEDIVNMFIDEARIAAYLHHPNIVQIYDLGMVEESFFIAMEFVDGLDLRRLCELGIKKRNFIPRELAVYLIAQVAAGLHYAHTCRDEDGRPMNIVHRDVSPQNVLISWDGVVKLCDFGIARAESRLTHTRTGEFKGKFSYMSPEQFGQGPLDRRSDIFTLGILLYEVTAATRVFRARSEYETMRRITEGDVRPPSAVRPDFPPALEQIVMKALAVKAEDRYQTAQELQEALEEWLFEQRARVGPRQMAEYLKSLQDSLENDPEVIAEPEPLPGEPEEVAGEPGPVDSTMELSLADAEILELVDSEFTDSESADSEFAESENDQTIVDLRYRFDEGDEEPTQIVIASAQAVEVRQVSAEEARARRGDDELEEGEMDSTLVDLHLEEQSTFPVVQTPNMEVMSDDEADDEEEELFELIEILEDGEEVEAPQSIEEAPADSASFASLLEQAPEINAEERPISSIGLQNLRGPAALTGPMERVTSPHRSGKKGFILPNRRVAIVGATILAVISIGLLIVFSSEKVVDDAEVQRSVAVEMVSAQETTLRLDTDPPGASVVANGLLVPGKTPLAVPLVAGQENDITVLRQDYKPARFVIAAPQEGSLDKTVSLEREKSTEFATLELRSTPSGARVWLNGEGIGRTPLRLDGVRANFTAHIQLELPEHRPFIAWVDLRAQQEHRIEGVLHPAESQLVEGIFEPSPAQTQVIIGTNSPVEMPAKQEFLAGQWLTVDFEAEGYHSRRQALRLDRIGGFYLAPGLEREDQQMGKISLEVQPISAVYIDSRSLGSGPFADLALPAGEQTIVVETIAGSRLRVPLEVKADEHRDYLVLVDGDEIQVQERALDRKN